MNDSVPIEERNCDFCGAHDTSEWWSYPCRDFILPIQFPGSELQRNVGGWWACADCHRLISANDRRGLAKRSLERGIQQDPRRRGSYEVFAIIRASHNGFFKNRTGEPTREERSDVRNG